jgi:hypothetical protein
MVSQQEYYWQLFQKYGSVDAYLLYKAEQKVKNEH